MKNIIKQLSLIFLLFASLACSLPFLAGDASDAAPTEINPPERPTPHLSTPADEEVSDGADPCLVGAWSMDTYALNNKLLDLTNSPMMYVVAPSQMSLNFMAEGAYTIHGETIVQTDIPDTSDFMQITGTHSGQGSYSADGASLFLTDSTYSVEFGTMTSSIDGEISEVPVSAIPFPEDFMSPPSSTNYQCHGNSLEITYEGPTGMITEEWRR